MRIGTRSVIRILTQCSILLGVAFASVARAYEEPQPDVRIQAVANRLLDALRLRDTSALRAVLHPSFRLATILTRGDETIVMTLTADQYVSTVAQATGAAWNQALHKPLTSVHDKFASLWATYDFRRGTVLDHCGGIGFHLANTRDGWKIVNLTDTHRTACEEFR